MPAAASTPSAETNSMVARQSPVRLPIAVPMGAPSAVAALRPVMTVAMARPRRSGGASAVAAATAAEGGPQVTVSLRTSATVTVASSSFIDSSARSYAFRRTGGMPRPTGHSWLGVAGCGAMSGSGSTAR